MGNLKKIGLGIGIGILGFFILIVAVGLTTDFEKNESTEFDSRLEPKTAIANPTVIYEVGEPVRINQLEYNVTKVRIDDDMPGIGIWSTGPNEQILIATMTVKNVGKDPQRELTDFRLEDSEDRRFSGYFAGSRYGDNPGILQPGQESRSHRLAIFTIPFDLNLEYFLTAEESIIPLGKGKSFDVREAVALELAENENDPSICDLLDNNTRCIASFAKNKDEPNLCLNANNSLECMDVFYSSYGGEICNLLETDEIELCKKKSLIRQTEEIVKDRFTECDATSIYCYISAINTNGISTENLLSWKTDEGELLVCNNYFQKIGTDVRWPELEQRNEFCAYGIGAQMKNLSICDIAGNWQNECYDKVALSEDWFTLDMCDALGGEAVISRCYTNVAERTGDVSICSKSIVKETYGEELCFNKVKKYQN